MIKLPYLPPISDDQITGKILKKSRKIIKQFPKSNSMNSFDYESSQDNTSNVKQLYFLHIPKTAGTSLISILDNQFDHDAILQKHNWGEMLQDMPNNFTNYSFFRGHFGYGLYRLLGEKPFYITMLRDPVKQIPSMYQQMRRNYKKRFGKEPLPGDTFETFIKTPRRQKLIKDNQTRHIVLDLDVVELTKSMDEQHLDYFLRFASPEYLSPKYSDSELLDIAKKRLQEFAFFGIVEKFQKSLDLLCYVFHWKPIPYISKLNVTEKSKKNSLSEENLSLVKQYTKIDQELYDYADNLFEERHSSMVDDLKSNFYQPYMDALSEQELINELLEKHYENSFNLKLLDSVNVDFSKKIHGSGWYPRESEFLSKQMFRWSGPDTESIIDLPLSHDNDLNIEIEIMNYMSSNILDSLKLFVNSNEVSISKLNKKFLDKKIIFQGIIPKTVLNTSKKFTRLIFKVNETISPIQLNPQSDDDRKMALAFKNVKISPVGE